MDEPTDQQLYDAIRAADKAGDTEGVKKLSAYLMGRNGLVGSVTDNSPAQPAPQTNGDTGHAATLMQSLANGWTGGLATKLEAGIAAPINYAIDHIRGTGPRANLSLADEYQQAKDYRFNLDKAQNVTNPGTALAGNVAGAIASPLNKIAAPIEGAGLATNVARLAANGALYGGLYGGGQSQAGDMAGLAHDTGVGAVEGAAGNLAGAGLVHGAGKVLQGVTDPVKVALHNAGVQFTPGQAIGGFAQSLENKLTSLPWGGDAIRQRLAESGQSWNNATLNEALGHIGKQVPENVAGSEAMDYGQRAFNAAYDEARQGMRFAKTPEFDQALGDLKDQVVNGGVNSLSDVFAKRFNNVLTNTVERRLTDGEMSGDTLKTVVSQLRKEVGKYAKGADADGREYANAVSSLADLIDQGARANPASDPAAVALMDKADKGYALWTLAERAAAKPGGEVGGFTPKQYLSAVKSNDPSVRNRDFAAGNAFNQPYAQNSLKALGADLPNSFTADRQAAMKLLAELGGAGAAHMGVGMVAPALAGPAAAAVVAPSVLTRALYSKPVNSLMQKALFAGPKRIGAGKALNALAPKIGAAAAAGVLGIQHTTP